MKRNVFRAVLCFVCCALMLCGCNIRIRTKDVWTDTESVPPENNNGFINYSYFERNDSEMKITAAAAGGKAPYELVDEHDEDMHALFSLLKMDLIPPDEVHLKPDLFTKSR